MVDGGFQQAQRKTCATMFVAIMLVAPLGALTFGSSWLPTAAADPAPAHDDPDHGLADPSDPAGFWNQVVGFSTKSGYRLVFAWDTDEPVAGIVRWGMSETSLTEIVRPVGNVVDSAQIAIMDIPREDVDNTKRVHFQVQDQITGALSPIKSFPMGNAWTSDFSDGVYEINALMQIDTQALPDGIPTQVGLQLFGEGVEIMAERLWDASDGFVRMGHVLITDTTLNYPANIPFGVPVSIFGSPFGGVCPVESQEVEGHIIQNTLADFLVETVPPADSHTYGELDGEPAIAHPCTAFYIGREGWLRIPDVFWRGDLDIASTMMHELGHYAFAMPDLYPVFGGTANCLVGTSGTPNNSNGRWDISVMHNSISWQGTETNGRWIASEFDRADTPCNRDGEPVSWNKLTQYYNGIPNKGRFPAGHPEHGFPDHSDSAFNQARGNPDGDGLNVFILDHGALVSDMTQTVRNDPPPAGTPKITIVAPGDSDEVGPTMLNVEGNVNRLAPTGNTPPHATLQPSELSGPAGTTITFTLGAQDDEGLVASWNLDFGDGSPDVGGAGGPPASVQHTFNNEGKFDVTLTATDDEGAVGQAQVTIDIGITGGMHQIGNDPEGDVLSGSCGQAGTCERSWVAPARDGFDLKAAYILDIGNEVRFAFDIKDADKFLNTPPAGGPPDGQINHISSYQLTIDFSTTPATNYQVSIEKNFDENEFVASLGKKFGTGVTLTAFEQLDVPPVRQGNILYIDVAKDLLPELAAVTTLSNLDATSFFVQEVAGGNSNLATMDDGLSVINNNGQYTLNRVELIGYGAFPAAAPKDPPTTVPSDAPIQDNNGDVFGGLLVTANPGVPVPHMDIEAAWFDNDEDFLYVGLKVDDIPADPLSTAQVTYHVNLWPDYDMFGETTSTFRGLRVEALLSGAEFQINTLPTPPGVQPTDGTHKFALHLMTTDGTRSFFGNIGDLPLSSMDADTDIVWWVVPRAMVNDPLVGDTFSRLGADTGFGIKGALTVNTGDLASGGAATYPWKDSGLALSVDAGGLYTGVTGQPIPIVATPTGGAPPYTCQWSSADPAIFADATQCATTVTFGAPGDYFIDVDVTDDDSDTASDTAGVDVNAPTGERVVILLDGGTQLASSGVTTGPNNPTADWIASVDLSGLSGAHTLDARWFDEDDTLLASDSVDIVVTGGGSAYINIQNPGDGDEVLGTITISGSAGHGTNPVPMAWGPGGAFESPGFAAETDNMLAFCATCQNGVLEPSTAYFFGPFEDTASPFDGTDGQWFSVAGFAGAQYSLVNAFGDATDIIFFDDWLDTFADAKGMNRGETGSKSGTVPAGSNWAFTYLRRPSVATPIQTLSEVTLTLTPTITAPTNLVGVPMVTSVDLSWTPPSNNGGSPITSYDIERDGAIVANTGSATPAYTDSGLSPNTPYEYRVRAVNGNGPGPFSATLMVSTTPDVTPPTAVTGLAATTTHHSATLLWNAASDPETGIAHYKVYRDGNLIAGMVDATTYTDSGLTPSTTYLYEVSAVNGAGLEGTADSESATTGAQPSEMVRVFVGATLIHEAPIDTSGGDTPWSTSFDTTTVADGSHVIRAEFDDGQGGGDSVEIDVLVNNLADPFVRILAPTAGETIEPPFEFAGSFSTDGDEPAPVTSEVPWWLDGFTEDPFVQDVYGSDAFRTFRQQLEDVDGFFTAVPVPALNAIVTAFTGDVPAGLPATIGDGWDVLYVADHEVDTLMGPADFEPKLTLSLEDVENGVLELLKLNHIPDEQPVIQDGIGPGSAMLQTWGPNTFICTASFVTQDPVTGTYYLATAGHCLLNPNNPPPGNEEGPDSKTYKPTRLRICVLACAYNWAGAGIYVDIPIPAAPADHPVRWARQGGVGNDFGIIRIPAALESELRFSEFRWGGPTGFERGEPGRFIAHFGHGVPYGSNVVTQGRYGQLNSQSYFGGMSALSAMWGGDSGSAVVTAHLGGTDLAHGDAAAGTLTHGSAITVAGQRAFLPFMSGTDWERGLDAARVMAGIPELALVNEDGTLDIPDPVGPTADFTFTASGLDVQFFDGSIPGDEAITSWEWDFDGLGTSSAEDPQFTFPASGTYQVTLTVTDADSLSDDITQPVTVNAIPDPWEVELRVLDNADQTVQDWIKVAGAANGEEGHWSFDWDPGVLPLGGYTVETRLLQDGATIATDSVEFLVGIINSAPELVVPGQRTILEGVELTFAVTATDADNDPLDLLADDLPSGATFTDHGDGTGEFRWTPPFAAAGDYTVSFTADDGLLTDTKTVDIQVTNNDRPPEIQQIGPQSVPVTMGQSINVRAFDPDGQPVTFTATGASVVHNGQGLARVDLPVQGTPGSYQVTVTAHSGPLSASTTFTVSVVEWAEISLDPLSPTFVDGSPGSVVTLKARVVNEGSSPLTVTFATESDKGWATTAPAPVSIPAFGSTEVSYTVTVGSNAARSRITLEASALGFPGVVERLYSIVQVPVVIDVQMAKSGLGPDMTGKVTTRFLDGSPAAGVRVSLEDRYWLDMYGLATSKASGTTSALGVFEFQFRVTGASTGVLPLSHTITVEAERYSRVDTMTMTYQASLL